MRFSSIVIFTLFCIGATATPGAERTVCVFALGFTRITDESATVVFTTSAEARASVTVSHDSQVIQLVDESVPSQIHRLELKGLKADALYAVAIRGVSAEGLPFEADTTLKAGLRPRQVQPFEHRTYLGVAHADDVSLIRDLGAGMVRVDPTWDTVEPRQGQRDEARLKKKADLVAKLHESGIEPLILLGYANPWAKPNTDRQMTWRRPAFGPPDHIVDWTKYVEQIMRTMKGNARFYETWNEPDAGYLATGTAVESNTPKDAVAHADIFRKNDEYWLGDRYVPLAMAVRQTADAVDPAIVVLGPSWNHDYHATRGDICFSRGLDRYLNQYSFHNYVDTPHSFERWEYATDQLYMTNTSRLMEKFKVNMPIAVTEWGIQSYDHPKPQDGFASRSDAQKFLVKSLFYYLNLDRVSILILHQMGYNDPWSLLHKDEKGVVSKQPAYFTYRWLCRTFNRKLYRPLAIEAGAGKEVRAIAILFPEAPAAYVVLWQNRIADGKAFKAVPEKNVVVRVKGLDNGDWTREQLDIEGQSLSKTPLAVDAVASWDATIPTADDAAESTPLIWRLTPPPAKPKN